MKTMLLLSLDAPASAGEPKPKAAPAKKPAAKAAGTKETRGEEILHELFRLCGVDLRASAHGKELAREFASLKGGH